MRQGCEGPVWVVDDLTLCFQQRFLKFIFPLTACALSLLLIVSHVLRHNVRLPWARHGYKPIPTTVVEYNDIEDENDGEDVEDAESDLMLHKALSLTTPITIEQNRPRWKNVVTILEIVALVGELGVSVKSLATPSGALNETSPTIGRLVSWAYMLMLVIARLVLSTSERCTIPKLWNHTASLYSFQWLCTVMVFRSVLIHPTPNHTLTIIDFLLSSFLFLLTITTRKGNQTLLVRHEDGIPPPREQFASLLALASFAWLDPLVWQGFRKSLEMPDVWNLLPSYQAAAVLADFRQARRTSSLAWSLLRYFDRTLLIQGAWTIFSSFFSFMPTWLLKLILEYLQDPENTPKNAAWLYVSLLFVCATVQGVADGQALWRGRKLSVKLRAIIIGELYAKALRRKAGAITKTSKDEEKSQKLTKKKKIFSLGWNNKPADANTESSEQPKPDEPDAQANIGKIINLMAIDSFKVSEICAYLHYLWASFPVQTAIAIYILYKILGFSSLAGIGVMTLMLPLNLYIASRFRVLQHEILAGTDARIHSTNEVLQNIRIIKYFAWEQRFEDIVNEKRKAELKNLRRRYMLWACAATVWYGTPILITLISFFLYTIVEGKKLVPSVAFPALSTFSLLRIPLDQLADMIAHVQESKASIDRVENFLNEEETEKYTQLRSDKHSESAPRIALENATLSWGPSLPSSTTGPLCSQGNDSGESFCLINMDVSFRIGQLNVIAGPTGSGKTSLLMALLGEMTLLKGSVFLPGGTSDRADLRVDPATGLTDSVAYCAQEAWLVNATIKDNILFASPFDQGRYEAVIKACGLGRDLEILDAGDQTLVGEKGISLSGGQKQRISLARGMYSKARHLLLDDCLSAVDSHTAKHIFREAIMGPLMQNRTCILVSHNISLVVPNAAFLVVLDNGRITAQGTTQEVVASGILGDEILQSRPASVSSKSRTHSLSSIETVKTGWENGTTSASGTTNGAANGADVMYNKKKGPAVAVPLREEKIVGSVKFSTIIMYLRAMGPWYFWFFALLAFGAQQVGSLATNIWIREWANAYPMRKVSINDVGNKAALSNFRLPTLVTADISRPFSWRAPEMQFTDNDSPFRDDVNPYYYLGVYAVLAFAYIFTVLVRELILFGGSLHASWRIHKRLLNAVTHAKFKFFDSTPLGRLMNRFSKDLEAVDQEVAATAIGMLHCLASVILIVILISVITPKFLIAAVFITAVYFTLGAIYLNSSRDLKRLESIQRSPLYQQFGETLSGIVTIRAYGDGARFIHDNHVLINTYNRPYLYLWGSNRWLAFRVDITGALVSFFTAAVIVMSVGQIDAGAAGLALTYAVTFTENVLWLVRLYAQNQQNMNSVERIEEYMQVEQEAEAVIPDRRPPADWPTHGALQFDNYSTRYRPDLDLVLKNVTFSVQPGERVGIVGRTGAGKSSLALALFRGLEAESGRILLDGVDIGQIGLRDLREAITIVPQDPTLFTGTIRSNLDPFNLLTNEQIFTALRRVHLIGSSTSASVSGSNTPAYPNVDNNSNSSDPDLTSRFPDNKNIFLNIYSPISESGSNLSQGQRQLLCLARALLKSPKVLMMDEATASIDYATDAKIQDTLRELKDNTIITIAHRLQTIIDYDKVLVLDHGEVVEYDGPWQLIKRKDGIFRAMCENSGNFEALMEGARKSWESKRLIDDE
ncbi:ATP-dependent bile acid permease [Histoplasma capsulatum var. duboisii H88]|uniref:ATP-dependent bile acid permease n=1 Tax=Ajellomyces capsulatus (strain H88) TaxID=544711 RepID=F0ULL9_AJEC8|nr:ATP-dependent bile acid permease [Histoplasma capsulatum var. duboisii H88]QSS53348.1 ATP-dependent bile acid permease [Histoplasma capsulatum var. duboisii H88]